MNVPDPRTRPTLSVHEAGALLGLGRSKSYAEARRWLATDGEAGIPVLVYGRTLRVPTARLLAQMGLDATTPPGLSGGRREGGLDDNPDYQPAPGG